MARSLIKEFIEVFVSIWVCAQSQKQHSFSSAVSSRGVAHYTTSQLQSAVAAAALGGRAGKHAAAGRPLQQGAKVSASSSNQGNVTGWRKSTGSTGVTMAYVNPSLSAHKASSAVERQREYLLDMIPSRSISQAANTWK
ncbi:transcriptional repressor p66 alpha-like [Boleophthalmus pectinirostris]|uniref:transcriptional repressor p66 alpha-like n=1 Tax=Boleophthalmus pectinirostris TaxID=150288 RepID=UPI00242E7336|nr:transcriptional repressor p66 alpha-like [Boleophthalmus pectinirostris]